MPKSTSLESKELKTEEYNSDNGSENGSQNNSNNNHFETDGDDKLEEIDPYYNRYSSINVNLYNKKSDTSDEETTNTVGNIDPNWYNDYDHFGYNLDGNKLLKPASKDQLDSLINSMDDPNHWKQVFDHLEHKNVTLSTEELDIIKRIRQNQFPIASYDPHPDSVDFFTQDVMIHPLTSKPDPKSRFTPSKWEAKKIMKFVRAIRKGYMQSGKEQSEKAKKPQFYDLWGDSKEEEEMTLSRKLHIPAPKLKLPKNDESYNPPTEYLLDKVETEALVQRMNDPDDEKNLFIPKKFTSMREVPSYSNFIQDQFNRCLDLYLCPRLLKKKIQVNQDSLIPKLPDPKDLQPFPSKLSIVYRGHKGKVTCLSVSPTGHWLATGGADCLVKVWDVATGRCLRNFVFEEPIISVAWNPNKLISVLAIAVDKRVVLLNPDIEADAIGNTTDAVFNLDSAEPAGKLPDAKWRVPTPNEFKSGFRVIIELKRELMHFSWHRKGDYFATLTAEATGSSSLIHQVSKRQTQNPFKKSNGLVQKVLFHPSKPILFIATQRYVRVYDMMQQKLVNKLLSGVKSISSMDIHPQGDNLIIGSYDKRLCWFDTDLSVKPYRTLRYHSNAIRSVSFHKRYPLFASSGDDGKINIFHGMVYNDLMQNPLIVPLKSLKSGEIVDSLGVLGVEFHPTEPWVFGAGGDGNVRLFT